MKAYEYRHLVGFEETNLVGNVYYVNHLRWQGRCREMFLREHAPEILEDLARDLALATVRCSCDYLAEIEAFDEIAVRMRLGGIVQNRITLLFEYWRQNGEGEELIARGEQVVACMRREGKKAVPAAIPGALREALKPYA
ncbi:MAG TPA: acyl-CoA thioesterase [Thermoanaerobaculia bacterium]